MVQAVNETNNLVHDNQWPWFFERASLLSKLEQVLPDPLLVL